MGFVRQVLESEVQLVRETVVQHREFVRFLELFHRARIGEFVEPRGYVLVSDAGGDPPKLYEPTLVVQAVGPFPGAAPPEIDFFELQSVDFVFFAIFANLLKLFARSFRKDFVGVEPEYEIRSKLQGFVQKNLLVRHFSRKIVLGTANDVRSHALAVFESPVGTAVVVNDPFFGIFLVMFEEPHDIFALQFVVYLANANDLIVFFHRYALIYKMGRVCLPLPADGKSRMEGDGDHFVFLGIFR